MVEGKGKQLAFWTVLAGLILLALSTYFYRGTILESWYCYRLRRGGEKTKLDAVKKLAELGSERSVPLIAELIVADDEMGRAGLQALVTIGGQTAFAELGAVIKRAPEDLQRKAADVLIRSEPPLSLPVTMLVSNLQGEQGGVFLWVLSQLIGKAGDAGPPVLQEVLRHDDAEIRRKAVAALWNLGLDEKVLVPLVLEAASDSEPAIRVQALGMVGSLGEAAVGDEALKLFVRSLKDRDPEVRQWAAASLATWKSAGREVVPALISSLGDEDPRVGEQAARALGRIDVASLVRILRQGPLQSRTVACRAMAHVKEPDAVPALVEILRGDASRTLRLTAVKVLGTMRHVAKDAVPALVERLNDEDLELRYAATMALADMGAAASDAVPALIQSLSDKDVGVRQRAALALKGVGRWAAPAVPALLEALRDPDVAGFASDALGAIGKEALRELLPLLSHEDPFVRTAAADALSQVQAPMGKVVPALLKTLDDPAAEVRYTSLEAIRRLALGQRLEDVSAVVARLEDEEPSIRFLAARVLAASGGEAAGKAIPVLVEVAGDEGLAVSDRLEAIGVLENVGRNAVPALIRFLKDKETALREVAAEALGNIGPEARAALGDLARAIRGADEDLRRIAERAIEKIRSPPATGE